MGLHKAPTARPVRRNLAATEFLRETRLLKHQIFKQLIFIPPAAMGLPSPRPAPNLTGAHFPSPRRGEGCRPLGPRGEGVFVEDELLGGTRLLI